MNITFRFLRVLAASAALTVIMPKAGAQGGPPFLSDDPDTPGNKGWEINVAGIGARNPFGGSYDIPNLDFNFGVGHRTQFKFEIPLSMQEIPGDGNANHFLVGPGNSLIGVKYRFYAHHNEEQKKLPKGDRDSNFGFSLYPQLMLNNPTRSLTRGIVEQGPQFILPLEGNIDLGVIKISEEVGYRFSTHPEPDSWFTGAVIVHEFKNKNKTELGVEFYQEHEVFGIPSEPKARSTTLGIGGRADIAGHETVRFIWMAGRAVVGITPTNGQPSWVGYAGIQFLVGKKRHSSDFME